MKQISGGHSTFMASGKFPRLAMDLRLLSKITYGHKARTNITGNGMAALKNRCRLIQFHKMEPRSPTHFSPLSLIFFIYLSTIAIPPPYRYMSVSVRARICVSNGCAHCCNSYGYRYIFIPFLCDMGRGLSKK